MNKHHVVSPMTSAALLAGLFTCATVASGQSIQIGYTNCLAVTNYSQSLMTEIGQFKWFFAHASVGANLMDGITNLYLSNSNFYQIHALSEDDTPPATTQTGVIYEYMRGNPGWQAKVDTFQTYVSNGWCYPKINLAMNKFCFVDQSADLNYYIKSMTNLEASHPQTVFVYVTMPLTTTNYDSYLYLRNAFNDGLRGWCLTNNRVLFDIADIESHDTNGMPCTFIVTNHVFQQLFSGYTTDGGHLNSAASQLVARGFYALAAALFAADRDNDGLSDGSELLAGTCPTDAQSVFKIISLTGAGSSNLVIQWTSASNRVYTLQRSMNLFDPTGFTNLLLNLAATPPTNSCTDSPPAGGAFFYRVGVHQ